MIMNNELEMIWLETLVTLFKVLSRNLRESAEENHEKHSVRIVDVPSEIRTEKLVSRIPEDGQSPKTQ
jgi:hypothetical protein